MKENDYINEHGCVQKKIIKALQPELNKNRLRSTQAVE
jgi:hypothetical protein